MGPVTVRLGNALGTAARPARIPKAPKPPNLGNLPGANLPHNDSGFGRPVTGPQPGQPGYVAPVAATSAPPSAQALSFLGLVKQGHPNWFPPVAGAPPGSVYHHGSSPSHGAGNPAQTAPTATAPANSATTQQPSPLDSTYYANVNANTFKVGNQLAGLGLQGSQADTALQSALGQLAYQQPRDELALEQRANQGGGLYSSVYGQNLGNLNHQYLTNQTAAQTRNTNAHDTISQRIAALEGGIPIYNADQAALSAGRVSRLAAANPGTGQGTGGLDTHPGAGSGPSVPSFTGGKKTTGGAPGDSGLGKPGSGGGGRNILGIIKQGHPNWFPTVPGAPLGSVYHGGAKPPSSKPAKTLSVRAGQAVSHLRARGY